MHVLIDDMRTPYIHNDLSQKLSNLLGGYESGDVVDLAGTKFGPVCSGIIGNFIDKLRFIDSSSPDWNTVYENNYNITHGLKYNKVEPLKCNFKNMIDFMSYVKSDFDSGTSYVLGDLNSSTKTLRVFSFVILFVLIRPDVNVDIVRYANRIFNQIRLDWYYDEDTHYESYYDATNRFIKRTVNSDRTVTVEGVGRLSEFNFLSRYTAVPSTFGSEKLYKTDEWSDVVRSCSINIDNTEDDAIGTTIADLLW